MCGYSTAPQRGKSISQAAGSSSCSPASPRSQPGSHSGTQSPSRSHVPALPIRIPRTPALPKAPGGDPAGRSPRSTALKGEAAAPRKTAKLGGWERSEELLSNRSGRSRQLSPPHRSLGLLQGKASAAKQVLKVVIERADTSRGWAQHGSDGQRGTGTTLSARERFGGRQRLREVFGAEFLRQARLLGLTDSLGAIHSNRWRMGSGISTRVRHTA